LNDKFKDLLSIATAHNTIVTESRGFFGEYNINLREATTNAPTMIQRLQEETAE
jgi:hypothetical protein